MRIEHLSLQNFRNYARLEVTLPPGPILIHGANAQGKTSLLEAVYYLATSRSPYTASDRQLINWNVDRDMLPFAKIGAEVINDSRMLNRIEIILTQERSSGEERYHKEIRVNGVSRRMMDLIGQITVVMFLPQDLSLIEGPPAERRRYMNVTLCQTDTEYTRALGVFEKALIQRNALLRRIAEKNGSPGELDYWDDLVTTSGAVLVSGRQRLLRELEVKAARVHRVLTGGDEDLELQYKPGFLTTASETSGQLSFDVLGLDLNRQLSAEEIIPQFRSRLTANRAEEISRGMTLLGPQRDELRLTVNGHDLGLYGSRGQNRTAVLALKLAELEWMRDAVGEWPILLLDEVAAELDASRRAYLFERISGVSQVLLTTTEPDIFTPAFLERSTRWHIHQGQIISMTSAAE